MYVYMVMQNNNARKYGAIAMYKQRTSRRIFKVLGNTPKQLTQEVVRQINTNCRKKPAKITIRQIPETSDYGKLISTYINKIETLRGEIQ